MNKSTYEHMQQNERRNREFRLENDLIKCCSICSNSMLIHQND